MSSPDPYLEHLEAIESAQRHVCRARHLSPDASEEFVSWANLRLLANDRAILRKFEGRSSIRTFLITVVQRLYLDWRNAEFGKWRPSAEAQRLGDLAIELERLVVRDRTPFEEAAQALVARQLAESVQQCERIWVCLPPRVPRKRASEEELSSLPAPERASDDFDRSQRAARARAVLTVLHAALAELSEGDRYILRLRYWDGVSVARIAKMTAEDQKALYRRFERLQAYLRTAIEAAGVTADEVDDLLGVDLFNGPDEAAGPPPGDGPLIGPTVVPPGGNNPPGPSTSTTAGGKHV